MGKFFQTKGYRYSKQTSTSAYTKMKNTTQMKEQTKVKGVGLYGQAWPWYLGFFLHARQWQLSDFLPFLHICRLNMLSLTVLQGWERWIWLSFHHMNHHLLSAAWIRDIVRKATAKYSAQDPRLVFLPNSFAVGLNIWSLKHDLISWLQEIPECVFGCSSRRQNIYTLLWFHIK